MTGPRLALGLAGHRRWDTVCGWAGPGAGRVTVERVSDARSVAEMVSYHSLGSGAVAVHLDAASRRAQQALLKPLEEAGERMYLCALPTVALTIRSRCSVWWFGPLSTEETTEALADRWGGSRARALARLCGGTPSRAEDIAAAMEGRADALSAVAALLHRDRLALADISRGWGEVSEAALRRWCLEVLADRPQVFSGAELAAGRKLGAGVYRLVRSIADGYPLEAAVLAVWRGR